jgi:hypothetical protein
MISTSVLVAATSNGLNGDGAAAFGFAGRFESLGHAALSISRSVRHRLH